MEYIYIYRADNSVRNVLPPFGTELGIWGKFFPYRVDPFSLGAYSTGKKKEVMKLSPM